MRIRSVKKILPDVLRDVTIVCRLDEVVDSTINEIRSGLVVRQSLKVKIRQQMKLLGRGYRTEEKTAHLQRSVTNSSGKLVLLCEGVACTMTKVHGSHFPADVFIVVRHVPQLISKWGTSCEQPRVRMSLRKKAEERSADKVPQHTSLSHCLSKWRSHLADCVVRPWQDFAP